MQFNQIFRLVATVATLTVFQAAAQPYPDRPIRVIGPLAAGGIADVVMRATGQELTKRLGQPVLVENRVGASGIIAAEACAHSAPDGYTLCILYSDITSFNPLLMSKLPYDPDRDFDPIVHLINLTTGIIAPASLPVNSVAELQALARAKPGSLNFGSVGTGSEPHHFLEWLNQLWGVKVVHVPYKGGTPVGQALLAGEVQFTWLGLGNFMGQIRGGKLKVLAVSGTERSALLPQVPTLSVSEVGLGDYTFRPWFGLAAPAGTPKPILTRLNAEIVDIYKDPKFREQQLISQGNVPAAGSIEEFATFLKEDRERAARLIKISKVRSE